MSSQRVATIHSLVERRAVSEQARLQGKAVIDFAQHNIGGADPETAAQLRNMTGTITLYQDLVESLEDEIDLLREELQDISDSLSDMQVQQAEGGLAIAALAKKARYVVRNLVPSRVRANLGDAVERKGESGEPESSLAASSSGRSDPLDEPHSRPISPSAHGETMAHPWERSGQYTPDDEFERLILARFRGDPDEQVLLDVARVAFYPEHRASFTASHIDNGRLQVVYDLVAERRRAIGRDNPQD